MLPHPCTAAYLCVLLEVHVLINEIKSMVSSSSSGAWTGTAAKCAPMPCTAATKPGAVAHGVMTGNPNGGVGSVVTYKCNANYKLVGGSAERKCLNPNSAWTGTAAKCAPIDCGNFPKPEGGGLSRNDGTVGLDGEHTTVGARAIVSCLAHHKLIRAAGDRRTCLVRQVRENVICISNSPTLYYTLCVLCSI